MLNSSQVRDLIATTPEKIGDADRQTSYARQESLLQSLVSADCQFIFTKDRELLSSYFQIRRNSYHNDKYMRGHFNHGEPDIYDYKSDLLVVCSNGQAIGGARLTYTTPEKRISLPSESDHFNFKRTFPEYPLERISYGEIHRLVLVPQFRAQDQNYARQLLLRLYARAVELGLKYIFVPSIPLRCRLYRQLLSSLNLKLIVRPDLILESPKYDNVLMYLTVLEVETQTIFPQIRQIVSNPQTRVMLYQFDGSYIESNKRMSDT